ncbi:N-acetylglucosamine kinase [Flavobacteriaceae bacterium AU392]|nr:N-acetylglucosamine kinase [Flavobacteriaceae bacterium]RKM85690.1 N-acetylglucosamine kinase [Flavobacteriaceae bacterium AU392]
MILIVDSGSTKCDWLTIDDKGNQLYEKQRTKGLNPAILERKKLFKNIKKNKILKENREKVNNVFFYGAGCGTKKPRQMLKNVLQEFFPQAKVSVKEDTFAAVYSTITTPSEAAIVCILGTGSNCSYYDGEELHQNVESLGYSIMDDASGNYFGKQLLRDYYFNLMPDDIKNLFTDKYNLEADAIKYNLYKQPNPNAYLASFAEFMFLNKDSTYIDALIKKGIRLFTKTMIMQYKDVLDKVPVHFAGSIAFLCQEQIREIAKEMNFVVGNFERRPIEGLVKYHVDNL